MTTIPKPAPSDDALIERLRARAAARLSLKRPTLAALYDAELDRAAADALATTPAAEPALYQCELEDGSIEHFAGIFGEVEAVNGVRVVKRTPLYVAPQPARETDAARDVPAKPDGEDDQFFTLVFAGSIKDAPGNPFKLMTPYGLPGAVGVGHAFRQLDRAEAALRAQSQP